jgi:ElaB/YqjD/DUF883 family membrane-anchored ribosome-binding protein
MSEINSDKLIEDLRAVIRDAEELLRTTAGQAGEHIAQARAKAEASLQSAKAMLAAMGATANARARDALRSADSYVQGNPWLAVGAGAAVGLLVGLLISRRPGRAD